MAVAFQTGPESSHHVPATRQQPAREISPETDPEDLIKRLKSVLIPFLRTKLSPY
jgi:hypothetical protein